MVSSERIQELANCHREELMLHAERERQAQAAADARSVVALFWLYLGELLIAIGAVVLLRL